MPYVVGIASPSSSTCHGARRIAVAIAIPTNATSAGGQTIHRAVRHLHLGDLVRQHDREQRQDENTADVDPGSATATKSAARKNHKP